MRHLLSELFDEIGKAKTVKERVKILQDNNTPFLQDVLYHTFHPNVTYRFSEIPDYTPNPVPAGEGFITLEIVMTKIYLFVNGHPKTSPNLTDKKANDILAGYLEMLDVGESKVLEAIILKKFKDRQYLNIALVKKAFPQLLG